ncbi:MAG TPA: hypothetical protein VF120_09175, partial [Ktedonobacterales bacterium]
MSQAGIFERARVYLFGERTQRLQEHGGAAHWLSYLLVVVQSLAVILALGHQQIQLLLSGDPAIVLIAAMSIFLLVATVVAADLCVLATLRRVPVLARNRQAGALWEHLAYLAFVLAVEGSTFALVLVTLDTDPAALVSSRPIIPPGGWLFGAQIVGRTLLTVWTSVQLFIVRGKMPPQWSTLILEARELMGGHAQRLMRSLNLDAATLAGVFAAYAAMSRPPARAARWWNRGLIRREAAALEEEDRQREAVVRALASFDTAAQLASDTPAHPPTGPGSPTLAPSSHTDEGDEGGAVRTPRRPAVLRLADPDPRPRRRTAARGSANTRTTRSVRTPISAVAVEAAARAAWVPGMSVTDLERA